MDFVTKYRLVGLREHSASGFSHLRHQSWFVERRALNKSISLKNAFIGESQSVTPPTIKYQEGGVKEEEPRLNFGASLTFLSLKKSSIDVF